MKHSFEKLVRMSPSGSHNFGIVINTSYGGFQLSDKALGLLRGVKPTSNTQYWEEHRQSPDLIETVTKLQAEANTPNSKLEVAYIPAKFKDFYEINEDDGRETVRVYPEKFVVKEVAGLSEKDIESIPNEALRQKLTELKKLSEELSSGNQ